jgi:hypothetical protein
MQRRAPCSAAARPRAANRLCILELPTGTDETMVAQNAGVPATRIGKNVAELRLSLIDRD